MSAIQVAVEMPATGCSARKGEVPLASPTRAVRQAGLYSGPTEK
jgi:hypothetical protein